MLSSRFSAQLKAHASALLPGLLIVGLMLLWAAHNGGYDADTWYWGALCLLGLSVAVVIGRGRIGPVSSRPLNFALAALAAYVAWSYLSIAWSQAPGAALEGGNRALLYLLIFAVFAMLPWSGESALIALLTFTVGVGMIAALMLIELANGAHVAGMFSNGRLLAPAGYFNAAAALFTITALLAVSLAAIGRLPVLLRGLLLAIACGCLQLSVLAQSRGWLFTLPLVLLVGVAVVRDRLRVVALAVVPTVLTLAALPKLLDVFHGQEGRGLQDAASRAGRAGLIACGAALLAGALLARAGQLLVLPGLSQRRRRALAGTVAALALTGAVAGGLLATHGHPTRFISRQWRGFTHTSPSASTGSHFAQVGSGRYDFWRVSLDALLAHPLGGLGQDNFADYYVVHRRTDQEPSWTHSLELRLLAHTGLIGFALFGAFLISAGLAVRRTIRRGDRLTRAVAGAALLPLTVWLVHGSVDWFWEIPALTGPALGFLAMAAALSELDSPTALRQVTRPRLHRPVAIGASALVLVAAFVVLGLPYLSVREVSAASDVGLRNPAAALRALTRAASLNPLSAVPDQLAGSIALQAGEFREAERRFRRSISREPGGWFAWLGDGLAASALGDRARARHDYHVAAAINSRQPVVSEALSRVEGPEPMTVAEAFAAFVLVR